MATANIRAVITAEDRASQVVSNFGKNLGRANTNIVKQNQKTAMSFNEVLIATAGLGIATKRLVGFMGATIKAANKEQSALTGLASITRAFGHDTDRANEAAKDLAKDGLMTVGDAATGLKNLLAAGFNLDQAIKLMQRFKDSAAFGRQSALEFGQAVTSATEGIKNGNSILVDNAGVTKNLSIILEEAGFSAQDLMKATTDANVRMALFKGIIKETNPQVGDAAKLTELFAGKQAKLQAQTEVLKARIGEALQPVLINLVKAITPIVEKFAKFTEDHPGIVAAILLITTVSIGLISVLGILAVTIKGLSPLFVAMGIAGKVSIAGIKTAFIGLRTLLLTPIALPAIAVGAAILALKKVSDAGKKLQEELTNTRDAINSYGDSRASFIASLGRARDAGRITQQEYTRRLNLYNAGIPAQLRASGGSVNASQSYMVGENGPELFVPNQAGAIRKNSESGTGQIINVTFNGVFTASQMEMRKLAQKVFQAAGDTSFNNLSMNRVVP